MVASLNTPLMGQKQYKDASITCVAYLNPRTAASGMLSQDSDRPELGRLETVKSALVTKSDRVSSQSAVPYLITSAMKLMRSPAARRVPRSLEPPRGVHRTTPSSRQPPGHGRCHRQVLARANLGKARIDPREDRAHLSMNVFEHRARSHLYFGFGESVSGSVCLDGQTREFTRAG
jgi:hypothetical protein